MLENRPGGRLRLLYLINGLGPGGAERSLAELLPFYMESGIDPLIVCLRHRHLGVESKIRDMGCSVRFLESQGWFGRIAELRRVLASEPFDLLHTTLFESDVLGRFAAVGTNVPVLTSLVNTSYEPIRLRDPNVRRFSLWATRVVDAWTARHLTTWSHAITEAVKESAVRHLGIPEDRVTVVERGRSPDRLGEPGRRRRGEARRRLGIGDEEEVIVNVARQEYQKGQRYLLEAVEMLARTRPRLSLLICGREGHATHDLREVHGQLQLGTRVRFLGDRPDVPEILAAADVFAFPSIYEGLGGAVIEAMALGLPIVASDIPALREVVQDGRNALLVPSGTVEPLASGIARLLDAPDMAATFGRRSREIFSERFTIERSAQQMIDLYLRIARSSGEGNRSSARTSRTAPRHRSPKE